MSVIFFKSILRLVSCIFPFLLPYLSSHLTIFFSTLMYLPPLNFLPSLHFLGPSLIYIYIYCSLCLSSLLSSLHFLLSHPLYFSPHLRLHFPLLSLVSCLERLRGHSQMFSGACSCLVTSGHLSSLSQPECQKSR